MNNLVSKLNKKLQIQDIQQQLENKQTKIDEINQKLD